MKHKKMSGTGWFGVVGLLLVMVPVAASAGEAEPGHLFTFAR
jgi:hypothetical protein